MERVIPERSASVYTVKKYDTLSGIARQQTGSADYAAIWAQNRDIIGDNPNAITPGMVLTIPGRETSQEEENW